MGLIEMSETAVATAGDSNSCYHNQHNIVCCDYMHSRKHGKDL